MEQSSELLVRLEEGGLAELDGQMQLDFTEQAPVASLRIQSTPTTASQLFEQGVDQEQSGYLQEAADSYRDALRIGGPNAEICCNLANVLAALGQKAQAMERYLQAIETDSAYADAWNNLGTLLCAMNKREEACETFRQALRADPEHASARYNLADTLEELGRRDEAAQHWKAYLAFDSESDWGKYARRQLG
jgi:tetratricopeptide (TPR) repeat protein